MSHDLVQSHSGCMIDVSVTLSAAEVMLCVGKAEMGKLARLIICVDGTWCGPDGGATKSGNITNIYRLYASVERRWSYKCVGNQ